LTGTVGLGYEGGLPKPREDRQVTSERGSATGDPVRPDEPARHVLIIDDDRDTADSLQIFLQHAGHRVRVAYDGARGGEAARVETPDVIVLGLGLPTEDGFQTARRLRREPALASITLIALSGYGGDEDRQRCRDAGFDYHLVKPVEAELMLEVVDAHGRERLGPRRVERLSPLRQLSGTR
jgi:DNA-binding response OmpR family regulator